MRRRRLSPKILAAVVGTGLLLTACANPATLQSDRPTQDGHHGAVVEQAAAGAEIDADMETETSAPAEPAPEPLREGERFVDLTLPVAYEPTAQGGGMDDYRCFVLDPEFTEDALVAGINIKPDNPQLVHHVIVHKVEPDQIERAEELVNADPDPGYSCFGGSGLERSFGQNLDRATWIGAWAPGGGERVMPEDIGIPVAAGSQLIVQMHYSLLYGTGTDQSDIRLRVADDDGTKAALETMLLPAPVELPCRKRNQGGLCIRDAAVEDVIDRFGEVGQIANALHILCGAKNPPNTTQSCTRDIHQPGTIRAVSGHMHLLGKSITVDVNRGTPQAQRVLDVPVWDFDEQGAIPLPEPVSVEPGDTLTVTCTHDQALRDQLPALADIPERYVVWGEGTTDEMCLGVVLLTRP